VEEMLREYGITPKELRKKSERAMKELSKSFKKNLK